MTSIEDSVDSTWLTLIISVFTVVFIVKFRHWIRFGFNFIKANLLNFHRGQPMDKLKEYNILVVGLKDSGKTTLISTILKSKGPIQPTQGFSIKNVFLNHYKKLSLWDLGGNDSIRPYWSAYFDHKDAVVFVLDGSANSQFQAKKLQIAFDSVWKEPKLMHLPFLIVSNKRDKFSSMTVTQVESVLGLKNDRRWRIVRTSIMDEDGIEQWKNGLEWLTNAVDKKQQ
eukprot:TRINITY_DN14133_c0_g1_i1.p1 TRINITY_DN14133_c0_g1~~TRINITY_DN14133_c0_g1_i1.p1  ORF type:complete len:226 (+),score=50.82 TRINITY_DN14133_c0_g1_i1:56-733(+)